MDLAGHKIDAMHDLVLSLPRMDERLPIHDYRTTVSGTDFHAPFLIECSRPITGRLEAFYATVSLGPEPTRPEIISCPGMETRHYKTRKKKPQGFHLTLHLAQRISNGHEKNLDRTKFSIKISYNLCYNA
jgi:hypothetical protein